MNDLDEKKANGYPQPFTSDNISIQGYSHKRINKECQDSSIVWQKKSYCGAIVCDGHGGDKYFRSAIGSRIACEVGKEMISKFMASHGVKKSISNRKAEDNLVQLENSIVSIWRERVEEHFATNPFDDDERFKALDEADRMALTHSPIKAYGSTFIGAVLTEKYSIIIQLGDGNALLFHADGTIEMPEELIDNELQFNVTTSLCNSDAALCFRHCYKKNMGKSMIAGITLTTDGIINCYRTEESYIGFMRNVFSAYCEEDVESAREELADTLNVLSEKGSGDDLSVVILKLAELKAFS